MKPKKPLISVIIPHLNQPDGLEACLGSLYSQTLERSAFEVIVVDNGSTSLPRGVIERYPETLLLQELKPGPGPARNRGTEAASADIFAFTDSDCRAHPDWLDRALRTLLGAPPIRRLPLSRPMRACLRTASSFTSSNMASAGLAI